MAKFMNKVRDLLNRGGAARPLPQERSPAPDAVAKPIPEPAMAKESVPDTKNRFEELERSGELSEVLQKLKQAHLEPPPAGMERPREGDRDEWKRERNLEQEQKDRQKPKERDFIRD